MLKRIKLVKHVVCMGETRNTYNILEGERPLRRTWRIQKDDIKTNLKAINTVGGCDCMHLPQNWDH
jgi:hypothetical protein